MIKDCGLECGWCWPGEYTLSRRRWKGRWWRHQRWWHLWWYLWWWRRQYWRWRAMRIRILIAPSLWPRGEGAFAFHFLRLDCNAPNTRINVKNELIARSIQLSATVKLAWHEFVLIFLFFINVRLKLSSEGDWRLDAKVNVGFSDRPDLPKMVTG